ncbi:MAG TPA: hypothetical protein IAB83_10895 [Candidatus Faecousia faecavium]|nr:hypothetical protein [Candidatus Faecousia faecavium]
MSSNFAGVTFDEQVATPSDDAIIRRAILDDGILTGCELSYTGSTLTMTAGQLMICGRQVKHPATQNWAVADETTGYARLLLTIDLTRTASKETFDQVVDTIEYASAVDGFASLVQEDINASGTEYQFVAAVVALTTGGISKIVYQMGETSAGLSYKSTIIVTDLPTGSTVTATGYKQDGILSYSGACKIGQYGSLFEDVSITPLEVGTPVLLVATISSVGASRCHLQEGIGLVESRTFYDLSPGVNTIILETTIDENFTTNHGAVFLKSDADNVRCCGISLALYTQKITKTATEKDGEWWFKNLDLGEWTLKAVLANQSTTTKFNIEQFGVFYVQMDFQLYPDDFTFSGEKGTDYEIYQDSGDVIPVEDYRKYKNWKAKVFTSVTVTPKQAGYVDVFAVGAGGGSSPWHDGSSGGGSGYTETEKGILLSANTPYSIEIGAGSTEDGGTTTGFGVTALGGKRGESTTKGGDGGSGGGSYKAKGGSDGSDGGGTSGVVRTGGKGQGTTTREFGEPEGDLYAAGGGGGDYNNDNGFPGGDGGGGHGGGYNTPGTKGADNTGSGAGGEGWPDFSSGRHIPGGSGIIVFRNAREVA